MASENRATWVVVDGYHFTAAYRRTLKNEQRSLLVIDDLADQDLADADVVLNQNVYAIAEMYAGRSPNATLLLGTSYALLRREFLAASAPLPSPRNLLPRILVTFGGGDATNATQRLLEFFVKAVPERRKLILVAGAANPHLPALHSALPEAHQHHDVELMINPPNLPELMASADVAVSAAGSTVWELACLGVPMLLVVTADCQRHVAERMDQLEAAVSLGTPEAAFHPENAARFIHLLNSHAELRRRARVASVLVDGRGSRRVIESLAAHPLQLRRVRAHDAQQVWQWANDPATREASFNRNPIPWEEHALWFERLCRETDSQRAYLACDRDGRPVGFVRFARGTTGAEMSLNLAPEVRGRGWGSKLIRLGAFQVIDEGFCEEVRARVKPSNPASAAAFRRAGFYEATPSEAGVIEFYWKARGFRGI